MNEKRAKVGDSETLEFGVVRVVGDVSRSFRYGLLNIEIPDGSQLTYLTTSLSSTPLPTSNKQFKERLWSDLYRLLVQFGGWRSNSPEVILTLDTA